MTNTATQAISRDEQLPEGTTQIIVIDVRGQNPSEDTMDEIAENIEESTDGIITEANVIFITDVPK